MLKLTHVPLLLCLLRMALGPVVIALAFTGPHPALFFALLLTALLSDIFDGIIARRLGVATVALRELDSRADLTFWLCTTVALYIVYPEVVRAHANEIIAVLVSEVMIYVVSFAKFGRAPSTHAMLSKLFGLALLPGLTMLLCFGSAGFTFYLMVALGILANTEVILILLILPQWQTDIPSSYHALRIRRGLPIQRNALFN
ncbi:MAG: CDP-alcohol phosphatidyltransferase family protein [Deltaproteobacteria bacterium]|nr:CDP-alcohol phosphatidyltransferase family protein [Deltaproteobacteria bacterium]